MKNKVITIVATIAILFVSGLFIYNSFFKVNTYKNVSFNEVKSLTESNKKFILFIGSDECSHCTIYKESLNVAISKYHVIVNYIDILKLTDEELAYIKARFAFSGTPTTVFVNAGDKDVTERVAYKFTGSRSSQEIIDLFKKYGYIKE